MSANLVLILLGPAVYGQIVAPPVPIRPQIPPIITVRQPDLNTSFGGTRIPTDLGLKSTLPGNVLTTPNLSNSAGTPTAAGTSSSPVDSTSYGTTAPADQAVTTTEIETVIVPPPPQEVHESPPDGGDDDDDDDEKPAGNSGSVGWKLLGGLAVLGLGLYGFLQPRA